MECEDLGEVDSAVRGQVEYNNEKLINSISDDISGDILIVRPHMKGFVRLLILRILKDKEMHGYEIMKKIGEMFGGIYEPSPGVIYPNLQFLEDQGLVESKKVDRRTVYRITEEGERYLEQRGDELEAFLEKIEAVKELVKIVPKDFFSLLPELMSKCGSLTEDQRREIRLAFERLLGDIRKILWEHNEKTKN